MGKCSVDDVIAVVTDVFFQARISAVARAAGRRVRFVASPEQLPLEVDGEAVVVDLDAALDVPAIIGRLKGAGAREVIAFGPHLDTGRRRAARAAGADRVLAKSKFVTELPGILAGHTTRSAR